VALATWGVATAMAVANAVFAAGVAWPIAAKFIAGIARAVVFVAMSMVLLLLLLFVSMILAVSLVVLLLMFLRRFGIAVAAGENSRHCQRHGQCEDQNKNFLHEGTPFSL